MLPEYNLKTQKMLNTGRYCLRVSFLYLFKKAYLKNGIQIIDSSTLKY